MSPYFMTPVHEYMSKALIAVRPTATLDEVLHTLDERDVSSVAVTEDDGTLKGVVSLTDLLRVAEIQRKSLSEAPSIRPPAPCPASCARRCTPSRPRSPCATPRPRWWPSTSTGWW